LVSKELLKDEVSEVDLVGPTLQSLKKLLENVPEAAADRAKFERIVHGILSACLVNIDAMRLVLFTTLECED
jgi:HEAT repeat-containing protein 5